MECREIKIDRVTEMKKIESLERREGKEREKRENCNVFFFSFLIFCWWNCGRKERRMEIIEDSYWNILL